MEKLEEKHRDGRIRVRGNDRLWQYERARNEGLLLCHPQAIGHPVT